MLSETAVAYLSRLTYREDAKRVCCFLPLAGIYWDDEIPDFRSLFELPEADRNLVLRLFGIRMLICDHAVLNENDLEFWNAARTQIPLYALFRRLELSAEDREAQKAVFEETVEDLKSAFLDADEVEISKGENVTNFSFTYDLTKSEEDDKD